jgi:uncharacterized membrane protein YdbT with pleckstrin-like domain
VKLPENISPAAARRRALLADLTVAVLLAIAAIIAAAGLGIVAIAAVITLLTLLAWRGGEALLRRRAERVDAERVEARD